MTKEISEKRFQKLIKSVKGTAGNPLLHKNLEFYEHETLFGAVVLDLVDLDYGWVVLCREVGVGPPVIDCKASLPSKDAARKALLARLEQGKDTTDPVYADIKKRLEDPVIFERVARSFESGEHQRVIEAWAYKSPPGRKH
jgi:hypothetical protein